MEDVEANRLSIEFMSDIPIEDFKDDLFNRHPFAIQIAEEIINRTNTSSIVIGIYGEWGEGKTSALNLIRKELEKSDRIIVVKFNPWLFNDESQLVMMFFSILIETLKILGKKSEIGKFITKYAGIAGCVNISVPGISIKPEKLMNEMGKIISGNDPEKLKYKIGEELKNNNKRVVVIMDDIDRLDKNEIQSVFKLVKLTADFDNICYLLSFDDNRVATALCEKYGKDKNDIPAGHNFIEKIVQVPLRIPKIDKISLRHYFENNIIQTLIDTRTSWKKEDLSSFGKYFIDSLEIKVTTPRICKRFANALRYKLIALKDEVGIVDLITLTCIEVFYPKVYNTIRNHPELFSGNPSSDFLSNTEYLKPLAKEIIEQATSDLATQEKTQITRLIRQLFPQISILLEDISLGNTENNWEEEWTRNRRIASRYYFHRFFSYSIPKFDISDTIVRNLIRDIKSKNMVLPTLVWN
ncbi:MAG: KAP family NTPase [Bacteroidales bacterium]